MILAKLAGGSLVYHAAPADADVWLTTDMSAEGTAGSIAGRRKVV
jgi:hypothetical protein